LRIQKLDRKYQCDSVTFMSSEIFDDPQARHDVMVGRSRLAAGALITALAGVTEWYGKDNPATFWVSGPLVAIGILVMLLGNGLRAHADRFLTKGGTLNH
jgi:hypothetical protein